MRRLMWFLFALLGLAAIPALAQAARDWRGTVTVTPTGAYVIGNPTAKVKLVEYVSYTCPHCAHFVADSKPVLKDTMVRSGTVRVELRHAVANAVDLSAVLLARCAGPKGFIGATEAMFAAQDRWMTKAVEYQRGNMDRLKALAPLPQLKALAEGSGLADLMRARGMTPAAVNACFATNADLNKVTAMSNASLQRIRGTPSFEVDGALVDGAHDWSSLEPKLRAAGAR